MMERWTQRIVTLGRSHRWLLPLALLALLALFGGAAAAEGAARLWSRARKGADRTAAALRALREDCQARRRARAGAPPPKPPRSPHRPASRMAAGALSVCMVFTLMPSMAFAAETETGLCGHHPAHTAECGYQAAQPGRPCGHEHTVDCRTDELVCGLEEGAVTDSGEPHAHTQDCYALDCPHERGEHKVNGGEADREGGLGRDESCGYSEAVEGRPCGYVCRECGEPGEDSGAEGVEETTITAFEPLDRAVAEQTVPAGTALEDLNLPDTLRATVRVTASEAAPVEIQGVTWEPDSPWDDTAEQGGYTFTPILPEGYVLADGVVPPEIDVQVGMTRLSLYSADDSNDDGYHDGDVAAVNAIIENNGLSATKNDPAGWATGQSPIVTWNNESPKRITLLKLGNKSLTGALDVSGLTSLTFLRCSDNQLTALDVSGLTSLTELQCYSNYLTELTGLGSLTSLTGLGCYNNRLTVLDVSSLTSLAYLSCSGNRLTALDVSSLSSLTKLGCSTNQLTALTGLGNLTSLTSLECSDNQLTELMGLGSLISLTYLYCYSNQLTELTGLGSLTSLTALNCAGNRLTALTGLDSLTSLTELFCHLNQLTALDVSGLTSLTKLYCYNNPLVSLELSDTVQLTVNSAEGGTVKLTGYTHGSKSLDLTATPDSGYAFQGWTANGTTLTDADANPVTFTLDGIITITPVFERQQSAADAQAVAAAKSAIVGGTYIVAQADAGTRDALKTALAGQINGLPGMADTGITVAADDITVISFTSATAGDADDPDGTDGSFSFTVALSKGSVSDTSDSKTGVITAQRWEPPAPVEEQFDLAPGGTYYFDLSALTEDLKGGADAQGVVNSDLPDGTLHYVPFTYAGTVNAYSRTEAGVSTEESVAPRPHSLFAADYNITNSVTWDELNTAGLIFGSADNYRSGGVDYTLRALSVGSDCTGGSDNRGIPGTNEWDAVLDKGEFVQHWAANFSWGQDTYTAPYRAVRGYNSARYFYWNLSHRNVIYGFRPVLEILDPDALGSDGLKVITLNWNGGSLGGSADNISVIVKSDAAFPAPAAEGLTRPAGDTGSGFHWMGSDGALYAPGASVPAAVTSLTAQWRELPAPVEEQFDLAPGGTYYFDLSALTEDLKGGADAQGVVNSDLPDGTLHYVPFTYAGTVNAYSRTEAGVSTEENVAPRPHSLFVADYNITENVSWDELNDVGLIFGSADNYRSGGVDYTLRAPSVGSDYIPGSAGDGSDHRGIPGTNEWDAVLDKGEFVQHWAANFSCGQDTYADDASFRAIRGYNSARLFNFNTSSNRSSAYGFRPVLEILGPDALDSDGLKAVALGLNGGKLDGSMDTISILVKSGAAYPAPAAEGLTRPAGDTGSGFHWLGSDGQVYPAGASVPAAVTSLTAQWREPDPSGTAPTITTASLPGGTVGTPYSAALAATGDTPITWIVSAGSLPDGLTLNGNTISGNPTTAGTGTFTVKASNGAGNATQQLSITIAPTAPTVTRVTVTPNPVSVQKGTTQQFSATVIGENNPSQVVAWTVTGGMTGTSMDTNGLLTVALGETAATLTVTATSTVDSSKSATATVTVTDQTMTRYTLTVNGGSGSGEYEAGAQITVTANAPEQGKRFKEWTASGITLADAAQNPVTITMPAGAVTLTATYEDDTPPATAYTVTFNANGGSVTPASAQTGADGRLQDLPTPTRSSHHFDGWFTAAEGGAEVTTATVFTQSSIIYAHWTYTGGGGSDHNSPGDNGTPPAIVPPPSGKPDAPTTAETEIKAKADGKGGAEVTVPKSAVDSAIQKAQEEAKRNGTQDNGIAVRVNVAANSQNVNSLTVNLPKATQEQIIENKVQTFALALERPDITLSLSLASVQEINRQAGGDVQLTATRLTDTSMLSGEAKTVVGTRPLFQLTATYKGGANTITDFGGGSVTVEIPYDLRPGESAGGLYLVYIDGQGNPQFLTNSSYDPKAKVLRGATTHFSLYAVGYKAPEPFSDIGDHWAREDIEFVTARGLMDGTGGKFSPDGVMSRAMFVTTLGRLAEIDPASYSSGTFTDVKADAYYAPYVAWAERAGIVRGVGGGRFDPDRSVTRQEMAVILSRYAGFMKYTLPVTREAVTFADGGSIGAWAEADVQAMQQAGVLMGIPQGTFSSAGGGIHLEDGNRFDPLAAATRAQAAAALRRYVELVIDRQTAQGWEQNDSGRWLYYENGKPVTGERAFDGTTYHFDQSGILQKIDAVAPETKKYIVYVVKRDNTLWDLAQKYHCTVAEIVALNSAVNNPDLILVGQEIKIPQR